MQGDDLLQENRFGTHDVFNGLAGHRVGGEADEIRGMPGAHGHAEFAVGLEAADPRSVPGAWIDDHEGAFFWVDDDTLWWLDAHQQIVGRPFEGTGVEHQFSVEAQHVGHGLFLLSIVLLAALAQHGRGRRS